jgi:4-hydroxyacetophenone monooxygenase
MLARRFRALHRLLEEAVKKVNNEPTAKPQLPIADRSALRDALQAADIATLLMVLTQYTQDEEFLERWTPYLGSPWNPQMAAMPTELQQELRERLFTILTQEVPPPETPIPDALMRKMMSINVGEPVTDEFIPLLMEQMGFEKPLPRREQPGRIAPPKDFTVLIIGAGLTGLLAGIKLEEAGYRYQIIEKNADIGGTWLENTYPGVAVDTPSHFYSYSFELNPNWSHYIPLGAEVEEYLQRVCNKYQLRSHITFNTKVTLLAYSDAEHLWTVTTQGPNGIQTTQANAIINCHGVLNRWSLPKIPGLQDFKGPVMHTAGWRSDVDLKGKRVALIGTGASAAQVGPAIVAQVAHLTVFQRSKHWALPYQRVAVPEAVKWALAHIPHYAEWFRFRTYWFTSDGLYADSQVDPSWPQDVSVSARNEAVRQYCLENMRHKFQNRPDLIEKMTPDYPVFGKRIVMDVEWLNMMTRANVALETSPIERVTSDAIVTRDGRSVPIDVIIAATGFEIAKIVGDTTITGRTGRNLGAEWGPDDPHAYLGITVPGYPNYFMTVGPSSGPAHAAGVNLIVETQVNYIIECLDLIIAQHAAAIEPTQAACDEFNADVDRVMKGMVWSHPKAFSYHKNSKGRVILASPYRLVDYWTMTRKPNLAHYRFE